MVHYRNNLTRVLDEGIIPIIQGVRKECSGLHTYLCIEDLLNFHEIPSGYRVAFRYPGATRGAVIIDSDLTILGIDFNDRGEELYCSDVINYVSTEFIGKKLIICD